MASLRITLNGTLLVDAGTGSCCTLSWFVSASRHEQSVASLTVTGMVERGNNKYDHLYWVEDHPLSAGDHLCFSLATAEGSSALARLQTHEQLEALRIEVNRAEAAGEADAARAAVRPTVRGSCALELTMPTGIALKEGAIGEITTVVCSGNWNREHRPTEWRLRLWSMPAESPAKGFWQPTEGGANVSVRGDA